MSNKRPGVAAAIRLCQQSSTNDDALLWGKVEAQWDHVLQSMPKGQGRLLATHNQKVEQLGEKLRNGSQTSITKQEFLDVVIPWKFAVGKPRPALWKHLRSNTEELVVKSTVKAISLAQDILIEKGKIKEDDIKTAIQALTQLQGVGPATASVILSLVRPDAFVYMFDEVIDCFLSKRTYTLPVYVDCNKACHDLAEKLDWVPARVARTLWIAARACAAESVEDLTLSVTKKIQRQELPDDTEDNEKCVTRQSKRRKKR